MSEETGNIIFENGRDDSIGREEGVRADYWEGYRKGYEHALHWRLPDTLPQENGTEAILWLTTDKGFADVSVHGFLKDGSWYWWDTHDIITRQDFILGWQPWPEPPTKA